MNIFSKMGLEKMDHASTFATRFRKAEAKNKKFLLSSAG
jgi:hypothetical protein